jgi:DNA-binding YbaB/EbfC family protein
MGFNMKEIQKLQQRMMKMQEDLANSTFEGTSGGGAVTIIISGKFEAQAVKIDAEVIDPEDPSMLEDLVLTAFKDAFEKATAAQAQIAQAMMGGMKLPPGMGF